MLCTQHDTARDRRATTTDEPRARGVDVLPAARGVETGRVPRVLTTGMATGIKRGFHESSPLATREEAPPFQSHSGARCTGRDGLPAQIALRTGALAVDCDLDAIG